jgi:hypothetical protein
MASFDSATFAVRGDNAMYFPAWASKAATTVYHYPGTDNNLIILGGLMLSELALPIRCTTTELAALYGKVGVSASLVFGYETHTALLTEITDPRQIGANAVYFATLHLLRV